MKVDVTYKAVWDVAWPIMLSSLANTVINFTDVAFVSRVSEDALAASALGGVFYFLLVMIGIALGTGMTILIARKAGEDRQQDIGGIFDHGIILQIMISIIMILFNLLFADNLMKHIVESSSTEILCMSYLRIRSFGLPFMLIFVSLRSFYTGIAQTKIITYVTVIMMLLNVIFNLIFTAGITGMHSMGIQGVALSSVFAEVCAAVYGVVYTLTKKEIKQLHLFRFSKISLPVFKDVMVISSPVMLQYIVSMGAWFVFFLMIEKTGVRSLAVSNVVRGIYMVIMTPVWGYSQAANSMVSNVIGQGLKFKVPTLIKKIAGLSFLNGLFITLLVLIFPMPLFYLITSDKSIIDSSMGSFYVISIANIIFSISMVLLSAVSGTGDTRASMFLEIFNIILYLVYVYIFTVVIPSSVEVIWGCEIMYWVAMAIFSLLYLNKQKWEEKKASSSI